MSKKISDLVRQDDDELDAQLLAAHDRLQTRFDRVGDSGRDLSDRERALCQADGSELARLKTAVEIRAAASEHEEQERADRVRVDAELAASTARFTRAVESTPSPIEHRALGDFARALSEGVPMRVSIETRSITSLNAGGSVSVGSEQPGQPSWLWSDCQIPFTPAAALTVAGPTWAKLVAQVDTPETQTKPSLADPALASAKLRAFAVVSTVSDQILRYGVGPVAVTTRLTSEVVYSTNAAFAAGLEAAAGTPLAAAATPSEGADLAVGSVWAATGSRPTALLVNPVDYASLSSKAAYGPGDTIAAAVVRYNGTALVVNSAITAGVVVAVVGQGFSAHASQVNLASLPILTTNQVTLRAEIYAALLAHDAGAAVAVTLTGAKKRA
jgi:hypothetical protein